VFGVTADWDRRNPNTHIAVLKALIRAGQWLDASPENRRQACRILSRPEYVGADEHVIANSMTGTWEYFKGDKRPLPDFNVFFRYHATYPYYSDAVWYLTQMRRWGQIAGAKPDEWYAKTATDVYRPGIYLEAAKALVTAGKLKPDDVPETDGYRPPMAEFIDGIEYDGRKPNEYLKKFSIGLKD
jgi:nitrate/nitrite transport system substrate-binding protein